MAFGGLKELGHMDSISCVAWACSSIKEDDVWDLECVSYAGSKIHSCGLPLSGPSVDFLTASVKPPSDSLRATFCLRARLQSESHLDLPSDSLK